MNHHGLMTDAESISYNFDTKEGVLRLVDGNCCDMSGCTALFESIDPKVKRIATFAGDQADTSYIRHGKDWRIVPPPSRY